MESKPQKPGPKIHDPVVRASYEAELSRLVRRRVPQKEIAVRLGRSRGQISKDVQKLVEQWQKEAVRNVDELRAEELANNRLIEEEAWRGWDLSLQDGGKIVERLPRGEDEQADADPKTGFLKERTSYAQCGDPRFLETLRKLAEDRRKMLGLDAPSRLDVSGKVEVEDARARLAAKIDRLAAGTQGAGDSGTQP